MGWEEKHRWIEILRTIVDDAALSDAHVRPDDWGAWDYAAAAA